MSERSRRRFLETSATLVSGLGLAACAGNGETPVAGEPEAGLSGDVLGVLARLVLPTGIDVDAVLTSFRAWLVALEPVAELDHPYLWTDEILYGPADPAPLWTSQLEALDLESEKRYGSRFADLDRDEQEELLRRQLPRDLETSLPEPAAAPHVAVGLLAYFYQTTEANDLCYQAAIEKQTCRGLDTAPDEPVSRG